MSDLPPGLDDFGFRLRDAAERNQRRRQRAGVSSWLKKLVFPVTVTALTVAAGAGAIGLVSNEQGPGIRAERGDGAGLDAPTDPAVITSSTVRDPAGGAPWVVRAYTNRDGEECVQVGRLQNGVFGQVQEQRFRALPPDAPGVCGPASRRRSLVAIERRTDPARTIVYGLAASRQPVVVSLASRTRRSEPAALGAFLTVFAVPVGDVIVRAADEPPVRFG